MMVRTRRQFFQTAIEVALGSAAGGLCMADENSGPLVIVSKFTDDDSTPDGDLGKRMWSAQRPVWFDQAAFSEARYPEFKTRVASCWSAHFLYFAFWCPYQTLTVYQGEDATVERERLWERDVVEAFIAPDPQKPSHYYEFEIAPNNQWMDIDVELTRKPFNDAHWSSGFEHATKVDAVKRSWTAEMRIPLHSMGVDAIHGGADWRVNFYRCDGPGDDTVRRMMSWGRLPVRVAGGTFHQPASFGIMRFVGK
jgi:Carbohydrate family 9 binding domain-like